MNFVENEHKILKFWNDNKIFDKYQKKNQGKKRWSFLDGPITANNPLGVHHAWGRTYKDLFRRYKNMQGYEQRFQNGFDCQGLWVEVEVEKEKGFKSKKDIEAFGIEKFIEACKERVKKYSQIQTEQFKRLGEWLDWSNSCFTMSDENNYTIWGFLKKCHEMGLLYKGKDVVPWCPRCGTSISQHEILTEEYKQIIHKSIFLKIPIRERKNTYFLVWTTTPWTLPGNVALAVNPELDYVEIEKDGEIFILIKEKVNLISEGKIIKTFKGQQLKGLEYQGIFDELPIVLKSLGDYKHQVILWKDISFEEGTGIVHIAPGSGQEDFHLGKELKLPVIDPVDNENKYIDGLGFLTGKSVVKSETRDLIFDSLKNKGFIFKIEDYSHRYPTCWRCKSELIFRLVDEWYIAMDPLRESLKKTTETIQWIPDFGKEREIDWLNNMHDWMISKKRYWGLALPIFECSCGNFEVIGSKEELAKRAVSGWDKFNGRSPHRPQIDEVKIKCSKCGQEVSRITDVGSPWLDAGIVPFSTLNYSSDKKYWSKWFPADLICESFPGQFKNWFYSLLVMSQVMENRAPVKTIFGYATVKDEKGEEMHKSKGNAIWFDDGVEKMGADPMRWLYSKQNITIDLKFGYSAVEDVRRKLLTLWNSLIFLKTYTTEEEFPNNDSVPKTQNILDQWIVSRFNNLIKTTTKNLDEFKVDKATISIEEFFINDLSLWYIRRSRSRLQKPENDNDRKEIINTLYYVLLNLTKLMAPIVPFLSEEIYQNLKRGDMLESVHLYDWPKSDQKKINLDLEEKMEKVRVIVSSALAERKGLNIKVRQPLASLKIKNQKSEIKNDELLDLIKQEINVKKIIYDSNIKKEIELDTNITSDLKEEGMLRDITRQAQSLRKGLGLKPVDRIAFFYDASDAIKEIIIKNTQNILTEIKADSVEYGKKSDFDAEKTIGSGQEQIWLAIKKK
ncbi:MAG: isoleucine--tRNA ligase [Patescibacteria group bacterium]|nr:isoleucine--tRNA ligase [Patescibacteria group bacterium]MBU1877284.1 isoleucine--tRNA ligase [Patescibacteria group bacterium]